MSQGKRPERKLEARPETLIVGTSIVKDVQNTKVQCFPKDMFSDVHGQVSNSTKHHTTHRCVQAKSTGPNWTDKNCELSEWRVPYRLLKEEKFSRGLA